MRVWYSEYLATCSNIDLNACLSGVDGCKILNESSLSIKSDEQRLLSVNVFADETIYSSPPAYVKPMERESQRKKKNDNSISRQALLQSPRQFKNILDHQFTFSSVPPALPPKASSKMKLKPVTINFDGGSHVALSHDPKPTSSPNPFLEIDSKLALTAFCESSAAPHYSGHVASKFSYMSTQRSDYPLTAASKLKPKPTFAQDYFKSNGNNNNSGISDFCDVTEDSEVQVYIPNPDLVRLTLCSL